MYLWIRGLWFRQSVRPAVLLADQSVETRRPLLELWRLRVMGMPWSACWFAGIVFHSFPSRRRLRARASYVRSDGQRSRVLPTEICAVRRRGTDLHRSTRAMYRQRHESPTRWSGVESAGLCATVDRHDSALAQAMTRMLRVPVPLGTRETFTEPGPVPQTVRRPEFASG